MRTRITHALAGLGLTVGLAAVGVPATASTGGTVDESNTYSNVGILVSYSDEGRYRCSGTLVAPTILLTAAHCTDGTDGRVAVSFEPFIDDAPPADLPVAGDPAAGYTDAEITRAGLLAGTAGTHPGFSRFTDPRNWNDVGVVVLDMPVTGVEPATIARVGTLDAYQPPRLGKTIFRAVGYGTEVRQAESGPQNPRPMAYPMVRRYVDMPGQKLTPQLLQANGNEKDPWGTGGTCFGDSGGPVLLNGQIVAVTSYGYTSNCRYLSGYQRVDIAVVQDWLDDVRG